MLSSRESIFTLSDAISVTFDPLRARSSLTAWRAALISYHMSLMSSCRSALQSPFPLLALLSGWTLPVSVLISPSTCFSSDVTMSICWLSSDCTSPICLRISRFNCAEQRPW